MKEIHKCFCGKEPVLRYDVIHGQGEADFYAYVECECGLCGKKHYYEGHAAWCIQNKTHHIPTPEDAIDWWNSLFECCYLCEHAYGEDGDLCDVGVCAPTPRKSCHMFESRFDFYKNIGGK